MLDVLSHNAFRHIIVAIWNDIRHYGVLVDPLLSYKISTSMLLDSDPHPKWHSYFENMVLCLFDAYKRTCVIRCTPLYTYMKGRRLGVRAGESD